MNSGDYTYIWQASDWPTWRFDMADLARPLADVSMVLDATANCNDLVTRERLFGWHAALFPTGYSGQVRINVGGCRLSPERKDLPGPASGPGGAFSSG